MPHWVKGRAGKRCGGLRGRELGTTAAGALGRPNPTPSPATRAKWLRGGHEGGQGGPCNRWLSFRLGSAACPSFLLGLALARGFSASWLPRLGRARWCCSRWAGVLAGLRRFRRSFCRASVTGGLACGCGGCRRRADHRLPANCISGQRLCWRHPPPPPSPLPLSPWSRLLSSPRMHCVLHVPFFLLLNFGAWPCGWDGLLY
jgi:hypothetical protein